MDPILVPAPPRSAYNENRRVSDLLYHQLKHFQHIERKRKDLGIPDAIARDIYTEAGAARYIAAITNALRGVAPSQPGVLAAAATATSAAAPPAAPAATVSAAPPATAKTPVRAKKSSAKKGAPKRRTAKKSKAKK